jgi:hypothetical protein
LKLRFPNTEHIEAFLPVTGDDHASVIIEYSGHKYRWVGRATAERQWTKHRPGISLRLRDGLKRLHPRRAAVRIRSSTIQRCWDLLHAVNGFGMNLLAAETDVPDVREVILDLLYDAWTRGQTGLLS